MGITADDFHRRWVDRLAGRRKSLGEVPADARETEDEPGRRERSRIEQEQDPDVLAGIVRGLDEIKDPKTVLSVISRLDHPSDLVRESIQLVLEATKEPAVVQVLREGLRTRRRSSAPASPVRSLPEGRARASRARGAPRGLALARAVQRGPRPLEDRGAREPPRRWPRSTTRTRRRGSPSATRSPRTARGRRTRPSRRWTGSPLPSGDPRHRLPRAREVRHRRGARALIDRYDTEQGRLRRELRAALKAVTHDDLGENPESGASGGSSRRRSRASPRSRRRRRIPSRRALRASASPRARGAALLRPPIFSKSVGFVLDTSGSMERSSTSPSRPRRASAHPKSGTRMQIAKQVLGGPLEARPPRQVPPRLLLDRASVPEWPTRPRGSRHRLVRALGDRERAGRRRDEHPRRPEGRPRACTRSRRTRRPSTRSPTRSTSSPTAPPPAARSRARPS